MAITTDVSQHTPEDSFRLHVKPALDAGASKDEVRDVVRFCAEMGLVKAVDVLRELDKVLTDL